MAYSPPGSALHGISQARIQSGLPFPSPGDLPDPGTEPMSLVSPALAGGFFTTEPYNLHLPPNPHYTQSIPLILVSPILQSPVQSHLLIHIWKYTAKCHFPMVLLFKETLEV